MAHELIASIRVALPEEPQKMADALARIATAWGTFTREVGTPETTLTFAVNETRARGGNGLRRGRPRKVKIDEQQAGTYS